MQDGQIPMAPIWDDVDTLFSFDLPPIDIIYGGFPCQDLSTAGTRKGLDGKRSGLFFEIVRLAEEIKPAFIFLENVPGIRKLALHTVGIELAKLGYDLRWDIVSAEEVGAPHLRKRWFLLAFTSNTYGVNGGELELSPPNVVDNLSEPSQLRDEERPAERSLGEMANADGSGFSIEADATTEEDAERRWESHGRTEAAPFKRSWWRTEPDVGRMVDGLPARMDRIKGLGNAVVPLQARTAFKRLMGL
jgi:DNA (cytosine-5)-methyltransferase 1